MKGVLVSFSVLISAITPTVSAAPIPSSFDSTGADKAAIETLLGNYTKAVSTKDRALFESLLLNKAIPFSSTDAAIKAGTTEQGTRHYDDFRKGVFEGPTFTQRFEEIHIQQDGPLANVSLVFVNTSSLGSNWGWKTLQLLKVDGRWKIASEFFTNHG